MRYKNNKGFTLVEMLVSVSLFTVAVTISLGALLVINNAYRITRAQQVAVDNLNFAIESMTRAIRTGYNYDCTGSPNPSMNSCSSAPGGESFSYVAIGERIIIYRFHEINNRGSIQQCVIAPNSGDGCDNDSNFVDLTSPDVDIEKFSFYVIDAERVSGQPRVVIAISVSAGRRANEMIHFNLQNAVTSRN